MLHKLSRCWREPLAHARASGERAWNHVLRLAPGLSAVFLVRIETDLVEYCDAFYNAVRGGSSLEHIEDMRNTMVQTIRLGLYEIVKSIG